MKMKNVILLMAMLISLLSANAQSNNPFVGVWQGVGPHNMCSIKVTKTDNDYIVQIITAEGYKKYKGYMFSQNEMSVIENDETKYGKWKIGRYDGETGHVIRCDGDYYSNYGKATNIFHYETANRMEGYTEYILVLGNEGELNMRINCYSKYYSGQRLLFTTGSPHDRSVYNQKPIVFVNW